MSLQICGFKAEQIPQVWPHIEHLVKKATDRSGGRFLPEHIRGYLESRGMQCWAAHDGAKIHAVFVTEILTWPTGLKECAVVLTGGSRAHEWLNDLKAFVEQWSRESGCRIATVRNGRLGWQRLLPDFKWTGVDLEKML